MMAWKKANFTCNFILLYFSFIYNVCIGKFSTSIVSMEVLFSIIKAQLTSLFKKSNNEIKYLRKKCEKLKCTRYLFFVCFNYFPKCVILRGATCIAIPIFLRSKVYKLKYGPIEFFSFYFTFYIIFICLPPPSRLKHKFYFCVSYTFSFVFLIYRKCL